MVIGNGLIAKEFRDFADSCELLIFASGISNSKCEDYYQFKREEELLRHHLSKFNGLFVYFSTCSIDDPDLKQSLYVQHKIAMEKVILCSGVNYIIFRLSNVVGHTRNPYTVVNFFYNKITNNEEFELWEDAYRNLIAIEDVGKLTRSILDQKEKFLNNIINIAAPVSTSVKSIVKVIEKITGMKAQYRLIHKGLRFDIDTSMIQNAYSHYLEIFPRNYIERIVNRHLK